MLALKKKDLYAFSCVLIFCSYIFSFYVSSIFSFFDIIFAICITVMLLKTNSLIIGRLQQNVLCLFCFLVILSIGCIIRGGDNWAYFGKETIRLFSFFFLFFVFLFPQVDRKTILKIGLLLCKLHIFYTLYELIYINILHVADINGLIFGSAIMNFYKGDETSQYFMHQSEFGIPFIRPFGFFLMPQKSGFIFILGYILKFVSDKEKNKKRHALWYVLFVLLTILSGAKTAIACLTMVILILELGFYPHVKIKRKIFILYCLLGPIFIFSTFYFIFQNLNSDIDKHVVVGDVQNDFLRLFDLPVVDFLLGTGFWDDNLLNVRGFICESYLIRFISQVGWINFFIITILSVFFLRTYSTQYNWVFIILFLGLLIHYFAIAPFYLFILAALMAHLKLQEKVESN